MSECVSECVSEPAFYQGWIFDGEIAEILHEPRKMNEALTGSQRHIPLGCFGTATGRNQGRARTADRGAFA